MAKRPRSLLYCVSIQLHRPTTNGKFRLLRSTIFRKGRMLRNYTPRQKTKSSEQKKSRLQPAPKLSRERSACRGRSLANFRASANILRGIREERKSRLKAAAKEVEHSRRASAFWKETRARGARHILSREAQREMRGNRGACVAQLVREIIALHIYETPRLYACTHVDLSSLFSLFYAITLLSSAVLFFLFEFHSRVVIFFFSWFLQACFV